MAKKVTYEYDYSRLSISFKNDDEKHAMVYEYLKALKNKNADFIIKLVLDFIGENNITSSEEFRKLVLGKKDKKADSYKQEFIKPVVNENGFSENQLLMLQDMIKQAVVNVGNLDLLAVGNQVSKPEVISTPTVVLNETPKEEVKETKQEIKKTEEVKTVTSNDEVFSSDDTDDDSELSDEESSTMDDFMNMFG